MPYPFSQRPFFSEFKQILEQYGCEYKTVECRLDSAAFYPVSFLERDFGGRKLRAAVAFNDNDRVEFSDIRRICRILEVPASAFGLTLKDWWLEEPDDDSGAMN